MPLTRIKSTAIETGSITTAKIADNTITDDKITGGGIAPTGTILPYSSETAPTGWFICDGRAVSRTTYSDLFSVLSTTWGYGDNSTTFNIPDLRGRFLRGHDDGNGNDPDAASRTASNTGGATGDSVGSLQGDATSKNGLTATSTGTAQSGGSHTHTITGWYNNQVNSQSLINSFTASGTGLARTHSTSSHNGHSHGLTLSTTIGSGDNETRPINASVTYIIKY